MNTYVKVDSDYLAHHGVLGQKWGQRNGPPYPLKPGDHSAAEKKAGWTKSVSGDAKKKKAKIGGISNAERLKAETSARRKTQNSIKKYDAAKNAQEEAKSRNKAENTSESKYELKKAKAEAREAERNVKEQLRADKGRELYAKGKTVEKYARQETAVALLSMGADAVAYGLAQNGNEEAAAFILAASNAAWIGHMVYAENQKNKLRAYYANS